MKRTTKASLSLHIVLLLSSMLFPFAHSTNGDFIDQICKKTPFPDICSSTLHSIPLPPTTDLKGVALAMVNISVLANATGTLNYIQGLVNQTTDPPLQRKLAICAEIYTPIVNYILPQAADLMSQGKFGLANYSMAFAKKNVKTCEKQFSGSGSSPLGDRNSIMQNLLDVAAAIIKLQLNKGFILI